MHGDARKTCSQLGRVILSLWFFLRSPEKEMLQNRKEDCRNSPSKKSESNSKQQVIASLLKQAVEDGERDTKSYHRVDHPFQEREIRK